MKLLRTLQLDASDGFVFDRAAAPGEWAVSGGFAFAASDPATLSAKARIAFRSGFLGVTSLGWSTLAEVVAAEPAEREAAEVLLAGQLLAQFGAPDLAAARLAAAEEFAFAASLCDLPLGTVIAVHRGWEGGEMTERFRTLTPRAGRAGPVFALVESDEPAEAVDLRALMARRTEGRA